MIQLKVCDENGEKIGLLEKNERIRPSLST